MGIGNRVNKDISNWKLLNECTCSMKHMLVKSSNINSYMYLY